MCNKDNSNHFLLYYPPWYDYEYLLLLLEMSSQKGLCGHKPTTSWLYTDNLIISQDLYLLSQRALKINIIVLPRLGFIAVL